MRQIITIKLIADDAGHIAVHSSYVPAVGRPLTPAQALALDMQRLATHTTGEHVQPMLSEPEPRYIISDAGLADRQ